MLEVSKNSDKGYPWMLKGFERKLKPGGMIVIGEPNLQLGCLPPDASVDTSPGSQVTFLQKSESENRAPGLMAFSDAVMK